MREEAMFSEKRKRSSNSAELITSKQAIDKNAPTAGVAPGHRSVD